MSFSVTAKLICAFVFTYANCWFSHDAVHMLIIAYKCLYTSFIHVSCPSKVKQCTCIKVSKIYKKSCLTFCLYQQVALEGLRISLPPGISSHMSRLVKICMNEDPGKRPRFDMIIPIIEKMKHAS